MNSYNASDWVEQEGSSNEVDLLKLELENAKLGQRMAEAQALKLKRRTGALQQQVRMLERQLDASTLEAHELKLQKLQAEGQMTLQHITHRDEKHEWTAEIKTLTDQLSSQQQNVSKKAAKVITALLPHPSPSGDSVTADAADSPAGEGVCSEDSEVQAKVEQLLLDYLSGSVPEEETLKRLEALQCSLTVQQQLPVPGATGPQAASTHVAAAESSTKPSQAPTACRFSSSAAGIPLSFVLSNPEKLQRLVARAHSTGGYVPEAAPVLSLPTTTSLGRAGSSEGGASGVTSQAWAPKLGDGPAPNTTSNWLPATHLMDSFGTWASGRLPGLTPFWTTTAAPSTVGRNPFHKPAAIASVSDKPTAAVLCVNTGTANNHSWLPAINYPGKVAQGEGPAAEPGTVVGVVTSQQAYRAIKPQELVEGSHAHMFMHKSARYNHEPLAGGAELALRRGA